MKKIATHFEKIVTVEFMDDGSVKEYFLRQIEQGFSTFNSCNAISNGRPASDFITTYSTMKRFFDAWKEYAVDIDALNFQMIVRNMMDYQMTISIQYDAFE